MSMMQKLLEINDEAVRLRTECEQLRSDQKTLQEICTIGRQRITELQVDLHKACEERDAAVKQIVALQADFDKAVENGTRLYGELDAARKQLRGVYSLKLVQTPAGGGLLRDVSHYTEAAEVDTDTDDTPTEPKVARQADSELQAGKDRGLLHGIPWGAKDLLAVAGTKTTWGAPQFIDQTATVAAEPVQTQEVTLSAYIVGDKVSPGALRIVWAIFLIPLRYMWSKIIGRHYVQHKEQTQIGNFDELDGEGRG